MSISSTLRILAVVFGLIALAACSSTQRNIQAGFDSNVLSYTVGKSYAEVAATKAMDDLLLQNKAYGEVVSTSQLPGGDTLYRHAKPVEASSSGFDLGVFGGQSKQYNYSLFYFRVDASGKITDYANGVVPGKDVSCLNYLGGIIQNCDNAQLLSNDIAALDASVRTSSGQPVSSWN